MCSLDVFQCDTFPGQAAAWLDAGRAADVFRVLPDLPTKCINVH
jgi:hypothetical protein